MKAEQQVGEHQHDEEQEQGAQHGQQRFEELHAPPLLDVAVEEEAEGAQLDGLEAVEREQVQQDRNGGQRQEPQQGGKEERHGWAGGFGGGMTAPRGRL